MTSKPTDSADGLTDEIRNLRASVWSGATTFASEEDRRQRLMLEAMRKLLVKLLDRGMSTAIMAGTYLMLCLRVSCVNHRFTKGGFERSLNRIGPLVGDAADDAGPRPQAFQATMKAVAVLRSFAVTECGWPLSRVRAFSIASRR